MKRRSTNLSEDSEEEEEPGFSLDDEDGGQGDSEQEELFASDSDDEAPEDVDFSQSKELALQRVRDSLTQIHREKDSLKQKRKDRDELYKTQKKQKLADMRLPDSIVQSLSSRPILAKDAQTEPQPESHDSDRVPDVSQDFPSDEEEDAGSEDENYLTLQKDAGVSAVQLKEHVKMGSSSKEAAEDFRRTHFSKVRRISAQDNLGKTVKRRARPR